MKIVNAIKALFTKEGRRVRKQKRLKKKMKRQLCTAARDFYMLGLQLENKRNYQGARICYEHAVELDPKERWRRKASQNAALIAGNVTLSSDRGIYSGG